MSKPASSAPQPREFIHVRLQVSTKDLLRRLNYEHRVSLTQILERVIGRAKEAGVLEEWIKAGKLPAAEDAAA